MKSEIRNNLLIESLRAGRVSAGEWRKRGAGLTRSDGKQTRWGSGVCNDLGGLGEQSTLGNSPLTIELTIHPSDEAIQSIAEHVFDDFRLPQRESAPPSLE
jgi:hypothetical protein